MEQQRICLIEFQPSGTFNWLNSRLLLLLYSVVLTLQKKKKDIWGHFLYFVFHSFLNGNRPLPAVETFLEVCWSTSQLLLFQLSTPFLHHSIPWIVGVHPQCYDWFCDQLETCSTNAFLNWHYQPEWLCRIISKLTLVANIVLEPESDPETQAGHGEVVEVPIKTSLTEK